MAESEQKAEIAHTHGPAEGPGLDCREIVVSGRVQGVCMGERVTENGGAYLPICQPCIDGIGQECHTPGCALWMRDVPAEGLVQVFARVTSLGSVTREISDLIDGAYPLELDREAWAWRRVMKVSEEVGEVTEAMLGWLGENPRKGLTHTVEDVRKELLDVALAALGACAHLDADADPMVDLESHAAWVLDRLRTSLANRPIRPEVETR